jgi:integrase
MGLIDKNPIGFATLPSGQRRRALTDAEFRAVLRSADARFRRVLIFLALSGCRQGEAVSARWTDWDRAQNVIILREHKTAAKTGKTRKIYLVPALVKLLHFLERQPEAHAKEGGGHIFLNRDGCPWFRCQIDLRMVRLRKKLGLPDDLKVHCIRHRYVTNALKTVPIALVSKLVGHASIATTQMYEHLDELTDVLHDAARQAVSGKPGPAERKEARHDP